MSIDRCCKVQDVRVHVTDRLAGAGKIGLRLGVSASPQAWTWKEEGKGGIKLTFADALKLLAESALKASSLIRIIPIGLRLRRAWEDGTSRLDIDLGTIGAAEAHVVVSTAIDREP